MSYPYVAFNPACDKYEIEITTMKNVLVTFVSLAVFSILADGRQNFPINYPHAKNSTGVSSRTQLLIGPLGFAEQDSNKAESDPVAVKQRADALIAFLDRTKDKRVERVVLRKYNWAGVAKEENVNFNVKIGEAKYTVIRPGQDAPAENYIVFVVKLLKKEPGFLVADDDQDGSVDRGFVQNKKAASEERREFDARKGLGTQHKDSWQADYAKAVETVCQYLGAQCGN
jgi:hypothetical protein